MRRRPVASIAAVAAIAALLAAVLVLASPGPGSSAAAPADRVLGPTDPSTPIRFSLVLRIPHERALARYAASVGDPASPDYRHFMSATAMGNRFGLPQSRIDQATAALGTAGLHVTATYRQRTALGVTATVADAERFFGVSFVDHVDADGDRYHAPLGRPLIPASLRDAITSVVGLSDQPVSRPRDIQTHPEAPGLHPADLAAAYDVTPLWSKGIQGQGQSVAVLSQATYANEDIVAYDKMFGLKSEPVVRKVVGTTKEFDIEVNLDLETIQAIAPLATIYDYEADRTLDGMYRIFNQIVSDGLVHIASVSWGLCELRWPSDARAAVAKTLAMAAADGITIFVASADSGAYDCVEAGTSDDRSLQLKDLGHLDPVDHGLAVDFPADNPNVVAVGGTRLSVRKDGSYLDESAWEDVLTRWSGGGGLSQVYKAPSWQQGPGVSKPESNGFRQLPDVSGDAARSTGIFVLGRYSSGGDIKQYANAVGGTSAAAPFWAGVAVLLDQYVQQQGVKLPGYMNPIFYQLAASPQPFPAFHDVLLGRNLHYHATPGWDFATGLGSPDAYNLARDLVAYLKANPS